MQILDNSSYFLLTQNLFLENEATVEGGGISIEMNLPIGDFKNNNVFLRNKSPYGPDISTYPIRIDILSNNLK